MILQYMKLTPIIASRVGAPIAEDYIAEKYITLDHRKWLPAPKKAARANDEYFDYSPRTRFSPMNTL
jgi:hypothetical protein